MTAIKKAPAAKSSAAPAQSPKVHVNGFHSNAEEYAVSILSGTPRGEYVFHCGQFKHSGDGEQFQANINFMVKSWNAHQALYEALSALLGQIESGNLQRNTSGDSEPGWAFKQIPLVQALQKAKDALALADAAQEGEANAI